ncbi:MAG: hypothetical protein LC687_04865 [Actinobacteria bacterium]|nr:hypothetical protein [Actinomycetota bacterium]MCA1807165.1 hypothetical protein [Actinomycetota bacterium]
MSKKTILDPVLLQYPLIDIGDIVEWRNESLIKLTRKQRRIIKKLDDPEIVALFLDQKKGEILLGTSTGENLIRQQQQQEMDPKKSKEEESTIFQRAAAQMKEKNDKYE